MQLIISNENNTLKFKSLEKKKGIYELPVFALIFFFEGQYGIAIIK